MKVKCAQNVPANDQDKKLVSFLLLDCDRARSVPSSGPLRRIPECKESRRRSGRLSSRHVVGTCRWSVILCCRKCRSKR